MKMVTGGLGAVLLALTVDGHALDTTTSCESVSSLTLPNTSITLAEMVPAGGFILPGRGPTAPPFSHLPAFCRVATTLTPSSDSDIKVEIWMPSQSWNGKFLAVGNGGWGGNHQLWRAGLGTAGGLRGGIDRYGTHRRECVVRDRTPGKAHRFRISRCPRDDGEIESDRRRVLRSRATVLVLDGLLHGRAEALMEAQRYPEDFDGIIAGAPANNQTHLCAWRIAVEARILQEPASVVPLAKLTLVNRSVLAACDALDGVTDALLTDPRQCHFDPARLLCRGVGGDDCLTAAQVEAVKMGYAPARRKTGELIYPG